MGKKKDKKKHSSSEGMLGLRQETFEAIIAIIFIVVAIFLGFAAFGSAGLFGSLVFKGLTFLFGVGYYAIPVILIGLGISFLATLQSNPALRKSIFGVVIFLAVIGLIGLTTEDKGGVIGHLLAMPLEKLLGTWVAGVVLVAILLIALVIEFGLSLKFDAKSLFAKKEKEEDEEVDIKGLPEDEEEDEDEEDEEEESSPAPKVAPVAAQRQEEEYNPKPSGLIFFSRKASQKFTPPPISLLQKDSGKPGVGDIKANANIIKRTLANFGIQVEMDEVSIGPTVTRYALKPAEGVKLSRIIALQNDLALALAAHPLRIEAPIPGKSLVGIEIPNSSKTTVGLGTLFRDPGFNDPTKPLSVCLGKGITGQSHFANLAKMPHGLIAGATGSGKSVTIHAVITSLLYRNHPDQLKFIMVDPKRVELTLYNNIPHLLTPVITDAKKAILSLKWAAKEMDRRYDVLEERKVRDIQSYHKTIVEPAIKKAGDDPDADLPESMPYIVIIIDELADLMQAYPRELEAGIVRLAQMSRAVGIHLILSTQRPSVNVVTGLIKANIPTRIALQVASQVDSKTILDMPGAEKLLGAGDMLYLSGEQSQPTRIQSAFISEEEVKSVVDWLQNHYKDDMDGLEEIDFSNGGQGDANTQALANAGGFDGFGDNGGEDDDELYEDAKQTVIDAGKASTSYIQRKLRVGYARAARLMDILEERGVIGPADGSKPREVLVGDSSDEDDEYDESDDDNREE